MQYRVSNNGYAVRSEGRKLIYLHRELLNAKEHEKVDHIDGNKLNNDISNLRICTDQENMFNRLPQKNNKSGIQGVNFYKRTKKWRAFIKKNGINIHLGYFNTKKEALNARNEAVSSMFGAFGRIQ